MGDEKRMEQFLNRFLSITKHDIEIRVIQAGQNAQLFTRNIEEIKSFVNKHLHTKNIYFGVYTREGKGGSKENVREATCLFADLDFKDYKNGESDAKTSVASFPLKPSIIVNSGNGYHAYWMFKESVKADANIETYLRGMAISIKSDIKVAEIARILRVPDTINKKNGKKVTIIDFNDNAYTLDDFEEYKKLGEEAAKNSKYDTSYSKEVHTIENLTTKCEFIKYCYENAETLSEPLWYAMISNIARLSPDGINLVHQISQKYTKYRPNETDQKILHALKDSGPHTCNYIKQDMINFLGFDCKKECIYDAPIANIQKSSIAVDSDGLYQWIPNIGLQRLKKTKDGFEYFKISNFIATIKKKIDVNNGKDIDTNLLIDIQGTKNGTQRKSEINVLARKFSDLKWVTESFADWAIMEAGSSIKDYVRHSIQYLSKNIEHETVYAHTGWSKDKNGWFYVMSDGAIGRDNIKVKLSFSGKSIYSLPVSPVNEIEAIKTSLSFIDIGKDEIVIPLWIYTYLSTLTTILSPMPNFLLYLYGKTGSYKTTISTLALSHFGKYSQFLQGHGSCSFEDTVNSVEKRSFDLKDTLMLVDDYCPTRNQQMSKQMYQTLHRIVRNYSNRSARKRLNPDATEKGSYEPRGCVIITGEDSTEIESTMARLLEIDIKEGDIDLGKLSELQEKADLFPHAMSSFINWIIPRIDKAQDEFYKEFNITRKKLYESSLFKLHQKHIEHAAFIIVMSKILNTWLLDKKIYNKEEGNKFIERVESIFELRQKKEHSDITELSEITQFYNTVETLIGQGKIYLYNLITGECTSQIVDKGKLIDREKIKETNDEEEINKRYEAYIRSTDDISEERNRITREKIKQEVKKDTARWYEEADPRIRGDFVGWYDEKFHYFIPGAIMTSIYKYYKDSNKVFPVTERTIRRRLKERGLLETQNETHLTVVKKINNKDKRVLKLKKEIDPF